MDDFRGRLTKDGIRIHHEKDFAGMRVAGALAARILDDMLGLVVPGITTGEIDAEITRMVKEAGAISATIGYTGYQYASCISVNHVVCHGVPGTAIPLNKDVTITNTHEKRRVYDRLKAGDILNIDVAVHVDGWLGDTSRM